MSRPAARKPCRRCGGLATVIIETREAPEHPIEATVFRTRVCLDCGRRFFTAEVEVAAADMRQARASWQADRRLVAAVLR